MADTQQAEAAPIGRIPDDPAIPTLNPADSPYKPVELPQEQPPAPAPPPEQRPPDNLGAVSHAGAAAYMIDQVLKGASHGYAVGQAYAADQYNKKLTAIQGIYNDQAQQVYQIAKEGRAGTYTGPAGPDGKPTFVPTPEFTQARQRMLASWQAMMQTVGQRIPQTKKGKAKAAQQGDPGAGADVTTLMQQAVDHKNDPQGALAATYQLGLKVGPPVVHQIAGFLAPEYIAQQQQGAKTQQAQGAAQASAADTTATVADINNKLAHAVQSGAPQDEIDKLIKQRDELSPSQRFPVSGVQRSGQGPDGKWYEWRVDENGKEIPDTRRPLSTAGLGAKAPKIGWTKVDGKWGSQLYDPETNQPLPNTFDSTKVPPASVLSLYPSEHTLTGKFVDSNGVLQTYSTTSTSQKNVPGSVGESGGSQSPAPRTMAVPNPKGLVEAGNLPIDTRPTVQNSDGTHSTEYSVSFADDKGREVLVPTVVDGKFLTPDGKKPREGSPEEKAMFKAAWQHYLDTGENLGKFDNAANADAYANQLHNRGNAAPKPKAAATPAGPSSSSGGSATHPVGYVGSPEYKQLIKQATDAQKDFNAASTNLSTMLKTAREAKQGDGAAQVGIVSSYLKTVVGGQGTGVRITKPEWDAAVKTRPFLEGIKASFSPDGYLTGAVISPEQVDQMVNEVHQKTKSLFENVSTARKRAQDQRTEDMSAGGLGGNQAPAAPPSNSLDDEILGLVRVKH